MRFIQKDLVKLVMKNEMNNNTRTTELNRVTLKERERKEAKIDLQLRKVVIKKEVENWSQVDKLLQEYQITIDDNQPLGSQIQSQMGGNKVY